jgi:hypothetical protein
MIAAAAFAAGFLLSLASYSLAGGYSFLFLAVVVGSALFLLFFGRSRRSAVAYVIGMCLAQESFGLVRFGLASAFGLILVLLYETLGARLNFTSGFIRYMLALAAGLLAYAVLLFAPEGIGSRLLELAALYPFLCLASYYLSSFRQKSAYELV